MKFTQEKSGASLLTNVTKWISLSICTLALVFVPAIVIIATTESPTAGYASTTPLEETPPLQIGFVELASGTGNSNSSFGIDGNGNLYIWGSNPSFGMGDSVIPTRRMTNMSKVAIGNIHALALSTQGELWTWGLNNEGQLGDGTMDNRIYPVQIMPNLRFEQIVAGSNSSFAIDTGGTLWSWGSNFNGILGIGVTGGTRTEPVQVRPDIRFVQISAGLNHTMALDDTGVVWAWGSNGNGQIGAGVNVNGVPTRIRSDLTFTQISAGNSFSMAINSNNRLWTWGTNSSGQLGDGTGLQQNFPVQIRPDLTFSQISGGTNHAMAIDTNNNLWVWGSNQNGCLGNGTTIMSNHPIQIRPDLTFSKIYAANRHSLAITTDGHLWTWGHNQGGRLGDGTTTDSNIPILISVPPINITASFYNAPDAQIRQIGGTTDSSFSGYIDLQRGTWLEFSLPAPNSPYTDVIVSTSINGHQISIAPYGKSSDSRLVGVTQYNARFVCPNMQAIWIQVWNIQVETLNIEARTQNK